MRLYMDYSLTPTIYAIIIIGIHFCRHQDALTNPTKPQSAGSYASDAMRL